MKKRPVAITVSVNYADILPRVLEANLGLFDHWYIVTSEEDLETQQILSQHQDRVTTIIFDFRQSYTAFSGGQWHSWRPFFNKGGALRLAQNQAYQTYRDNWYLILDTDIVIRSSQDISVEGLNPDLIYGPRSRWDYRSWQDRLEGRPYYRRVLSREDPSIIGCFQLYRSHRHFYANGQDTRIDADFTRLWPEADRSLLDITVDHLGCWLPGMQETVHGQRRPNEGWLG